MKTLAPILLICLPLLGHSQKNYVANPHVAYSIDEQAGDYLIRYTFKDHHDRSCSISWRMNKTQADRE